MVSQYIITHLSQVQGHMSEEANIRCTCIMSEWEVKCPFPRPPVSKAGFVFTLVITIVIMIVVVAIVVIIIVTTARRSSISVHFIHWHLTLIAIKSTLEQGLF